MTRIGFRRFVPSFGTFLKGKSSFLDGQNSRTFLEDMFLKLTIVNETYLWTKISLRKQFK